MTRSLTDLFTALSRLCYWLECTNLGFAVFCFGTISAVVLTWAATA